MKHVHKFDGTADVDGKYLYEERQNKKTPWFLVAYLVVMVVLIAYGIGTAFAQDAFQTIACKDPQSTATIIDAEIDYGTELATKVARSFAEKGECGDVMLAQTDQVQVIYKREATYKTWYVVPITNGKAMFFAIVYLSKEGDGEGA